MAEWKKKYIGLIPGAEVEFPEENWVRLTSRNGNPLMTYRFPCESPRALIFIYHGMHNHSNVMAHLAEFLTRHNFLVLAHDHENHGKSGGRMGQIRSLYSYVDDAITYFRLGQQAYPGLPIFIIGESMGGFIATALSRRVPEVRGMILLAPALALAPDYEKCLRRISKEVAFVYPGLPVKKYDLTMSSRNPHFTEYHEDDPYIYTGKIDAGTGEAFFRDFESFAPDLPKVSTPFLVVQGGLDNLTSEDMIKKFVNEAASQDKQLMYIPEMCHSVQFEPNVWEVLEAVAAWLNERV